MNQTLQNKSETPSIRPGTKVRIPWRVNDDIPRWNETCAWAMEQFGLPGGRYTAALTEEYIEFHFNDDKDAIHFSLRWM